ncbi:MAG: M28 family peptidase [Nitrospinales bacterium]
MVLLLLSRGLFAPAAAEPADLAKYRDVPWRYLQTIAGMGPRNPGSPGHQMLKEYILQTGRRFADAVVPQPFTHRVRGQAPVPLANIEMRFNGDSGAPILIGAHYDTRPFADEEPDPTLRTRPIPGVNDGGSGTAVLLALAQLLHDHKPKNPVHLVFFDGEDYGAKGSSEYLLGSMHYARQLRKGDKTQWPRAVVVIDMIGDKDLQIYRESHSVKSAPWLIDIIDRVARQKNNFRQFKSKAKYSILDDHYPFIARGIPSVLLIDFDYPHWHTQADTLDKCSSESLSAVFTVLADTLAELQTHD